MATFNLSVSKVIVEVYDNPRRPDQVVIEFEGGIFGTFLLPRGTGEKWAKEAIPGADVHIAQLGGY